MVNDIISGSEDYYSLLGVEKTATNKEIRRAFRMISLKMHPDKVGDDEEKKEKFMEIAKAYEILSDDTAKEEYDRILKDGVPWQERYYGRYAHKFGMQSHDVRKVLIVLFLIANVIHYIYLLNRWKQKRRRVKEHPYYQQKLQIENRRRECQRKKRLEEKKEASKASRKGRPSPKREEESDEEDLEPLDELPDAFYHIDNLDKPRLSHLLWIRFLEFPWTVVFSLYKLVLRYTSDDYDHEKEREKEFMEKFGLTKEELEEQKEKSQKRFENFKTGTRFKQYKRYMKKMGRA